MSEGVVIQWRVQWAWRRRWSRPCYVRGTDARRARPTTRRRCGSTTTTNSRTTRLSTHSRRTRIHTRITRSMLSVLFVFLRLIYMPLTYTISWPWYETREHFCLQQYFSIPFTGKIVEKKVCSNTEAVNGPSRVLLSTTSPSKPTHTDVQVSSPRLLNKVNF